MRRLKRLLLFSIVLFSFLSSLSNLSYAHSGGTDSKGGHYDRSAGEYHYHHGYPAHQHTNEQCPYNFKNNVDQSSRGSSSYSSGGSTLIKQKDEKKKRKEQTGSIALYVGGCAIAAVSLSWYFSSRKKRREYEEQKRQKEIHRKLQWEEERSHLVVKLMAQGVRGFVDMPFDTDIGDDGMPKEYWAPDWGNKYTRYRSAFSRDGNDPMHRKECRYGRNGIKVHVFSERATTRKCAICNPPDLPDRKWYDDYLNLQKNCIYYEIDIEKYMRNARQMDRRLQ